jgi:hypothetical protein
MTTYLCPDASRPTFTPYIHCRLFEPRVTLAAPPRFGLAPMSCLVEAPPCCLCGDHTTPAQVGFLDCFGESRLFVVCTTCYDRHPDDLDHELLAKFSLQPAPIETAAE